MDRSNFEAVNTKEELVRFARFLADEFRKDGNKWENQTVDQLLDDLAIILESGGFHTELDTSVENLNWQNLSRLLYELSIWDIGQ